MREATPTRRSSRKETRAVRETRHVRTPGVPPVPGHDELRGPGEAVLAPRGRRAEPIVRRAVEGGVTFFDTADTYSGGASERITGRLLRKLFGRREEYGSPPRVLPEGDRAERRRPVRRHILDAVDASLGRLGTDHMDLYQIHRWEQNTPIEETWARCTTSSGRKGALIGASRWPRGSSRGAVHRKGERPHAVRVDADPLQPRLPRGGTGDDPTVPRPGRGDDAVQPARPGLTRPCRAARARGSQRTSCRTVVTDLRCRQQGRRQRRRGPGRAGRGGSRPWGPARADRAGLVARPSGSERADCRGDQARSP